MVYLLEQISKQDLRTIGLSGKIVEFFGSGVTQLSISDRETISNMCPEYGALMGFFPVDKFSIDYLQQQGKTCAADANQISVCRSPETP